MKHFRAPFICLVASAVSASGQSPNSVVFAHGAADAGSWQPAMSSLRTTYGVPTSVEFREATNANTSPVGSWRDPIVALMGANATSLLVGHSLGGLASRHATAQVSAGGILTIGAPHGGIPLAGALPSALNYAYAMSTYCSSVYNLIAPGAVYLFSGQMSTEVVDLVSWLCPSMVYALVDVGARYIEQTYPSDFMSLAPGTTFLGNLPVNQPNSVALRGTIGLGQNGGPLALVMEPAEAESFGNTLIVNGLAIMNHGAVLESEVDWESEHALRTHMATIAAQEVGWNMITFAQIWCTAVTTGVFQLGSCAEHDGFVPTSKQDWIGAAAINVLDAVHTRQPQNSTVIGHLQDFICLRTQRCTL